ncbi:hypothetical protein PUN28_000352 [Cardiocondyla obscurior]|uniref:Uncharacterized protein n=1 Tax=Cardiocondyla obscurior TaxID=286306 RepID=A0AAW2GZC7_9HYME
MYLKSLARNGSRLPAATKKTGEVQISFADFARDNFDARVSSPDYTYAEPLWRSKEQFTLPGQTSVDGPVSVDGQWRCPLQGTTVRGVPRTRRDIGTRRETSREHADAFRTLRCSTPLDSQIH